MTPSTRGSSVTLRHSRLLGTDAASIHLDFIVEEASSVGAQQQYIASAPEFPGLVVCCSTREAARKSILTLTLRFLADAIDNGDYSCEETT